MRRILGLLILFMVVLIMMSYGGAVMIYPNTQFTVGNETYTVNAPMSFHTITIDDTYIIFNDTGFYVNSQQAITISLVRVDEDMSTASNGDTVLDFYSTIASGSTVYNLSGFPFGNVYSVYRNSVWFVNVTASSQGRIQFSNSVTGQRRFQLVQVGSVDSTAPVISNVAVAMSNPKDTEAGFGWENFSCTVTDASGVGSVSLRLTYPNGSLSVLSMAHVGSTYYHTLRLGTYGNYSYRIQAVDVYSNSRLSSVYPVTVPPNWDINEDGVGSLVDFALISNQYNEVGSTGWIREDVDNNGVVDLVDMVLFASHYGEGWWV